MSDKWMRQCDSANILLVEGNDDCNIIKKFCKDNQINQNSFGFCNCNTDSQVLSKLIDLLKSAPDIQPKIIGVILDADSDIKVRYQQIKDKLEKYKLPKKMPTDGLIIKQENLPKLGIWIMPNNQDNGALEDFYLKLVTGIDTDFIKKCIKTAKQKKLTSFKPQHKNKAIMHTYFAWQDKPGMPLYSAINKIALNYNKEIAKNFKVWIEKLFS